MAKQQITADQYRIKGDDYNWMLCKPSFNKDGTHVLAKNGEPYYQPFAYFPRLDQALNRWFQLLIAEGFNEKAGDVDDLRGYLPEAQNRIESLLDRLSATISP